MSEKEKKGFSGLKSWLIVAIIAASILIYGLVVFFAIGDLGPADWNFGAVKDVPGQSPHSTQTYSTDYLNK